MVILWLMIINMGRSYDISHYISNQVYLNKRIIANLSRQWCFLFSIILFCIILFQSVQNLSIFFYISSSKIYRFLLFDYYFLLKISQFFIVDRNFFIFHPFFKIYQFLFYFFSKFPQIRIFLCYSFSKFTNFSSLFKISRFLNFFIFFSPSKLFQTFLYISNFSQISFKLSPLENLSIFQIYSLSLSLSLPSQKFLPPRGTKLVYKVVQRVPRNQRSTGARQNKRISVPPDSYTLANSPTTYNTGNYKGDRQNSLSQHSLPPLSHRFHPVTNSRLYQPKQRR